MDSKTDAKAKSSVISDIDYSKAWFTASDIVYFLNSYNIDDQYIVHDPINVENQLQTTVAICNAIKAINTDITHKNIIIPINMGNLKEGTHWLSLVITYNNGAIKALYADSLNNSINENLDRILKDQGISVINRSQLQQGDSYNCGPYTILNSFDLATTGNLNNETIVVRIKELRSQLAALSLSKSYNSYNNIFEKSTDSKNDILLNEIELTKIVSVFSMTKPNSQKVQNDTFTSNKLNALNSLSVAFSTHPYVAIIECASEYINNKPLYIALADNNKIDKIKIIQTSNSLNKVVNQSNDLSGKIVLLCDMYSAGNSRVINLVRGYIVEITNEDLTSAIEYFEMLTKSGKSPKPDDEHFREFAKKKFNQCFSPKDLKYIKNHGQAYLNKLMSGNVELVCQNFGKGPHVEFQGFTRARYQNPLEKEFNIGLAKFEPQAPYCCACCTLERNLIMQQHGIKININVTGISNDNFPPSLYYPSPSITNDPELFLNFLKELRVLLQKKLGTGNVNNLGLCNEALDKLNDIIELIEQRLESLIKSNSDLEKCSNKIVFETLPKYIEKIKENIETEESRYHKLQKDCNYLKFNIQQLENELAVEKEKKLRIKKDIIGNTESIILTDSKIQSYHSKKAIETNIENANQSIKKSENNLKNLKENLVKNLTETEKINQQILILKNNIEELNKVKNEVNLKISVINEDSVFIENRLNTYKVQITVLSKIIKNLDDGDEKEHKLNELNVLMKEQDEFKNQPQFKKDLLQEIAVIESKINTNSSEIKKLESNISNLESKKNNINEGMNKANEKRDLLVKDIETFQAQLKEFQTLRPLKDELVAKNKNLMNDEKSNSSKIASYEAKLKNNHEKLEDTKKFRNESSNSLKELKNKVEKLELKLNRLKTQLDSSDKSNNQDVKQSKNLRKFEKQQLFNSNTFEKFNFRDEMLKANASNPKSIDVIEELMLSSLQIDSEVKRNSKSWVAKVSSKTGSEHAITVLPETHHGIDHKKNVITLIQRIENGLIDKNTVIALERKANGKNLGMPDVIALSKIIEYNEQNNSSPMVVSQEIRESLLFQDAQLYSIAHKKGIKVVGIERSKEKVEGQIPVFVSRDNYMTKTLSNLAEQNLNVICLIGIEHVRSIEDVLSKQYKVTIENVEDKGLIDQSSSTLGYHTVKLSTNMVPSKNSTPNL